MKQTKIAMLSLFLTLTTVLFGQKIVKIEGDLSKLSGVKELNLEYDYSEMGVGKFKTEKEYTTKKIEEYNKEEAGRGDKWFESWEGSRERVYQPKFEELFNKYSPLAGSTNNTGAKYTLVVKTIFTEPGFNIGITSKPAAVSFEYIIIETGSDNIIAKFSQSNVPGAQAMGMDFDTSTRISESYAKAGKMFGGFLAKSLK